MAVKYIFLCAALLFISVEAILESLWAQSFVSETKLLSATQKKTLYTYSGISCASRAMLLSWVQLFCFDNQECLLTNIIAAPSTGQPLAGFRSCMTKKIHACGLPDGSVMEDGASRSFICDRLKCTKNQLQTTTTLTKPTYAQTCQSPFKNITNLGCVLYKPVSTTFCDAKQQCYNMGADILSPTKATTTSAFSDFIAQEGVASECWLGVYQASLGSWDLWNLSLGGQLSQSSSLWKDGDPNEGGCVRLLLDGKLADHPCLKTFSFACAIPGF